MARFTMPSLGADMTEGTLLQWLVKPGDAVHKGDVVAVVDTSKSAIDVECFDSGVVGELLVDEGATVAVGTPLATIDTVSAPSVAPAVSPAPAAAPPKRQEARAPISPIVRKLARAENLDVTTIPGTGRGGAVTKKDVERAAARQRAMVRSAPHPAPAGTRPRITPYARKLAADLGVDPATLIGNGVIKAADVRAATATGHVEPSAPQPPTRPEPHHEPQQDRSARMRSTIAAGMARSKREIPHYYLATTIDMSRCLDWLREHNRTVPVEDRIVPAALLLKAAAVAATRVPDVNGHWIDGAFVAAAQVDLGVAVSLRGGGLLVPVIADAARTDVPTLMRRLRDAVSHARAGRLRSSELTPASLTVTSLGDLGVEVVHGVIHPPQVALVGFGAVVDRPWAVDGLLGTRPVVTASLAADHRVTDGAVGARFLSAVDHLLRNPEHL